MNDPNEPIRMPDRDRMWIESEISTPAAVALRRKEIAEEMEAAVQKVRDYIKFGHIKESR